MQPLITRWWLMAVILTSFGMTACDSSPPPVDEQLLKKATPSVETVKLRDCVIYVTNGASPSVKKAAKELQSQLAEVIDIRLAIVDTPAQPMIALGDSPEARNAGIQAASLPYEGFKILTSGGNLFIVGRDIPDDGPTPMDGKSFGTLYGMYEFLQSIIGIRWLSPGKLGTYFPAKNPELSVSDLKLEFAPKFKYRNFFVQLVSAQDWEDFSSRNYVFACQWKLEVTDHGWDDLYPKTDDSDHVVEDRMQTYEKNPNLFEMSKNGQRVAPSSPYFYLCLSSPDLPADVAARIEKFYRHQPSRHIWCIGPNDGGPICYCPECEKRLYIMTSEEMGATGIGNYRQTWTPLVLDYYRKTAEIVTKETPDVFVNGLIYQRYEFAPREKPAPLTENFIAMMAPQHTAYGPIRLYDPVNENWSHWVNSWDGVFKHQAYYGLDFWIRQYAGAVMSPYPDIMRATFSLLLEKGYDGAYFYSNPAGSNAAYCWVMMQMLWKPDSDPQTLLEEFCRKSYGEGGAAVLKIYQLMEKNMRAFITAGKAKHGHNMSPEMMQGVYAASWPEFETLYQQAAAGVKTPGEKWRFSLLENNLKILYRNLYAMGLVEKNPNSPLYLSPMDYEQLVGKGYPGGSMRGLIDVPAEAREFTRTWKALDAVPADNLPNIEPLADIWQRGTCEIICLAEEDGEASLQIDCRTDINKDTGENYFPDIGYYHIFNGTGERTVTNIAEQGRISFPVKKGEIYCVVYMPLPGKESNSRWKLTDAKQLRYALGSRGDKRGLCFFDAGIPASPLYFHIADGIKKFTLTLNVSQEVELLAPDGKVIAKGSGYQPLKIDRETDNLPSGWWKIKSLSNGSGFIQQGPELDGFFVSDPSKAIQVNFKK